MNVVLGDELQAPERGPGPSDGPAVPRGLRQHTDSLAERPVTGTVGPAHDGHHARIQLVVLALAVDLLLLVGLLRVRADLVESAVVRLDQRIAGADPLRRAEDARVRALGASRSAPGAGRSALRVPGSGRSSALTGSEGREGTCPHNQARSH